MLRGANLLGAILDGADLESADLQGAVPGTCPRELASLRGANLKRVNLAQARLVLVDFCYADLEGANLCGVDAEGANFAHANLRGATLQRASLYSAKIRFSKLMGADLRHASLNGHGSLEHSDLTSANLSFADLHMASLWGCVVENTSFEGATYDLATIWPDEPDPVLPRLEGPPQGALLCPRPQFIGHLDGEGTLIRLGFGPARFPKAGFVAIPRVNVPDDTDEGAGWAYVRFEDLMEVLSSKITNLGPSRWYAPPEINREVLEEVAQQVIPLPPSRGGYYLVGVNPRELGALMDVLRPEEVCYFLPGINLEDPQDQELYRQLLARNVEPSPFPHNTGGWCTKAARQMHIWFDP